MNNLFWNNSDILNSKDNTSSQNYNTYQTELPSNDEITPFDGIHLRIGIRICVCTCVCTCMHSSEYRYLYIYSMYVFVYVLYKNMFQYVYCIRIRSGGQVTFKK